MQAGDEDFIEYEQARLSTIQMWEQVCIDVICNTCLSVADECGTPVAEHPYMPHNANIRICDWHSRMNHIDSLVDKSQPFVRRCRNTCL